MKPNDHLNGKGCPQCKSSHLERDVREILLKYDIIFEEQKKFEWLEMQSLDFYLPQYNIGIECQGKQHFGKGGWSKICDFENIYVRDIRKYEKCSNNGVELIYVVSNNDYKNIEFYNDKKIVELAKAQTTACAITTYTKAQKTIAGTCGTDAYKVVVVDGDDEVYTVTPTAGTWTVTAKANLTAGDKINATAYAYGYAPKAATEVTVAE